LVVAPPKAAGVSHPQSAGLAADESPDLLPISAYLDEPAVAAELNGHNHGAPQHVTRISESAAPSSSAESVLGALLLGAAWSDVANIVHFEDYTTAHQLILRAIGALAADGKPCDPITVAQQLESAGHLVAAGGLAYLSELARNTPTAANVRAYASAVRVHAIKCRLPASHQDDESVARWRRDLAELELLAAPATPEGYDIERLDHMATAVRVAVLQGLGLDRDTVNAVIGVPNSGKTAFILSAGVHMAAGCKDWLGLKILTGPVLYVASEAPGSVKMRARAAVAQFAKQGHVAFYIVTAVPALGDERSSALHAQYIIASIRRVEELEGTPVVLLVVDTLASCLGGGDENGSGMVLLTNCAKAIAAATGVCVVLVHHPSKGDASSARGHTSLAAACDSIILVEKEAESGEVRTATLIKARDHATGAKLRFALKPVALPERDSFGEPLTSVVVEPATGIPEQRKRPSGKNQDTLLTDLERQYRGGKLRFTEADIIQSAKSLGMADRNRNAPRNAVRDLVKAGFLIGSAASYSLTFPPIQEAA